MPETNRWRRGRLLGLLAALAALGLWLGGTSLTGPVAYAGDDDDDDDGITSSERFRGEGNYVIVTNRRDERMRFRGNIDLSRNPGEEASPVNFAGAVGSCTDCQTYAIALQIALIGWDATTIMPQNQAIALNYMCTRGCHTVAHAIQFVVQVDDPREMPDHVRDAAREMERELREIGRLANRGQIDIVTADARVNALLDRFRALGRSLYQQRAEATEPDS
jgi:hypothetical protein